MGDEGKKIVDVLAKSKYDVVARFQGGPNAGPYLEFDGIKHVCIRYLLEFSGPVPGISSGTVVLPIRLFFVRN